MNSNLKKMGLKIFIFTILLNILLGYINFDFYIRLALTSFGLGVGIILIFFGGLIFPTDSDDE